MFRSLTRAASLLCLLCLPPAASAAEGGEVAGELPGAVALFERGEYAQARAALEKVVGDPGVADSEKGPARLYLAASLHALNESAAAFAALEELAARNPGQPIDPLLFLPDFLALAKKAAAQVELEAEREAALAAPTALAPLLAAPAAGADQPGPEGGQAHQRAQPAQAGPARLVAYGSWGLAGGAFVAGACTGIVSALDRGRLEKAAAEGSQVSSMTQREAARLSERAATLGRATNGLLIAGTVLVAAGAVLWIAGTDVGVAPTANGAVLTGRLP